MGSLRGMYNYYLRGKKTTFYMRVTIDFTTQSCLKQCTKCCSGEASCPPFFFACLRGPLIVINDYRSVILLDQAEVQEGEEKEVNWASTARVCFSYLFFVSCVVFRSEKDVLIISQHCWYWLV